MILRIVSALLMFASVAVYSQTILVPPYLQPGNSPTLSKEQKVLIWQTDSVQGNFKVEFAINTPGQKMSLAKISSTKLSLKNRTTYLYRAALTGLKFDSEYSYRVLMNDNTIAESLFRTRTKKTQTKFVVFGDCGAGTSQQAGIAYQVYKQKPEFVLVTGDNVYGKGLESEYRKNFFPYYVAKESDSLKGAPLMNSVPFYMILGNHDVYGSELDKTPDGLAYFYYNDLPLNGPKINDVVKLTGPETLIASFQAASKPRFPIMSNYSFEHGNVHITCIDANPYINPLSLEFVQWLANDLRSSKADWKIVSYHHPGFNSSKAHYDYQLMRLLSPVLEELGVDMVLTGHVHNYQRSLPLTFEPKKDSTGTQYVISKEGRVDGKFKLDQDFDGITKTKPKGIIYVVTGAGGAPLYDPALSGKPELWKHDPQDNWVPFTAKIVSDMHSFTSIETDGKKLVLKQLNAKGVTFDQIVVTK